RCTIDELGSVRGPRQGIWDPRPPVGESPRPACRRGADGTETLGAIRPGVDRSWARGRGHRRWSRAGFALSHAHASFDPTLNSSRAVVSRVFLGSLRRLSAGT